MRKEEEDAFEATVAVECAGDVEGTAAEAEELLVPSREVAGSD